MNETKRLQKEISEMVSVFDDLWALQQTKRFIINMAKDTKYEAVMNEKGGVE